MQRIVAGELRGRRLRSLPSRVHGVRPSSARVRSAIFDRLQSEVRGARVLDLFAGSGALAIEALSRGASSATLVEIQPALVAFLREQTDELRLTDRVHVWTGDARDFLAGRPERPYDLVLVDPPYADLEVYEHVLQGLARGGWLASDAVIVVEYQRPRAGADALAWPAGVHLDARRDHGSTVLEFLRVPNANRENTDVQ